MRGLPTRYYQKRAKGKRTPVSYTHLKALPPLFLWPAFSKLKKSVSNNMLYSMLLSLLWVCTNLMFLCAHHLLVQYLCPVSYTHLDVYKRQVLRVTVKNGCCCRACLALADRGNEQTFIYCIGVDFSAYHRLMSLWFHKSRQTTPWCHFLATDSGLQGRWSVSYTHLQLVTILQSIKPPNSL